MVLHKRSGWFRLLLAMATVSSFAQDIDAIRQKAQAGNAEAEYQLARAYYSGKGIAFDPKQGLQWLRKSADQNYAPSEFALGVIFQLGDQSVSKNAHEAAAWFRRAAQHNNGDAQTRLATMLAQGLISKQEAQWRNPAVEKTDTRTRQNVQGPEPFSFAEVETGLTGGITNKRMAALIGTYGVDFSLSATSRQKLADDGADETLLTVISASKRSI
jgi:TPR repeat protein